MNSENGTSSILHILSIILTSMSGIQDSDSVSHVMELVIAYFVEATLYALFTDLLPGQEEPLSGKVNLGDLFYIGGRYTMGHQVEDVTEYELLWWILMW